jgi:hypothetical protein
MADAANPYDPNAVPKDSWLDWIGPLLSHGVIQTPSQRYMARLKEQDLVRKYAQTQPDVDANIAQDRYNTARDTSRVGNVPAMTAAELARANYEAARDNQAATDVPANAADEALNRGARRSDTFNRFPQGTELQRVNGADTLVQGESRNGQPDSTAAAQFDKADSVWKPFEAQPPQFTDQPGQQSDMEQPSRMGPDGNLVIPGVEQPQLPQPRMAQPKSQLQTHIEAYHQAFPDMPMSQIKQTLGVPLSQEESTQFLKDEYKRMGDVAKSLGATDAEVKQAALWKLTGVKPPNAIKNRITMYEDLVQQGYTPTQASDRVNQVMGTGKYRTSGGAGGKQDIDYNALPTEDLKSTLADMKDDTGEFAMREKQRLRVMIRQRETQDKANTEAQKQVAAQAEKLELTPEEAATARGLKQELKAKGATDEQIAQQIAQTIMAARQNANNR